MLTQSNPTQFTSISYRNGLYQGYFNRFHQQREGYGLVFTTDNHMVMGSTWKENKANNATFVFYNHSHYVYGFWEDSIPHGFNAVRMGMVVIYAWYEVGNIKGRMLILYEQYNTAIVLQKGQNDGEFVEVQKGDVYSDGQLNEYIRACNWPQFQECWKTLIKFMSAYLIYEDVAKTQRARLQLLNQAYYRYGYDEGIAIVFDDEYNIISAGLHKKANLKSLGIRFTKENFVEEGNFNSSEQVYAFNFGQRPQNKVGKLYNNYLLKSIQFVNEYLGNPAKLLIGYLQQLFKSNLFRKLLAGQITTRKLDISNSSPQVNKGSSRKRYPSKPQLVQYKSAKQQQNLKELEQERFRLESYRKQIYETINKRSRVKTEEEPIIQQKKTQLIEESPPPQIINKSPVSIKTRVSRRLKLEQTRSRNRSPIFTPEKNQSRSPSPSHLSPFKERIRSKIFPEQPETQQKKKKYQYHPITQELYPKHSEASLKNYNSPHEQLDFSRSGANQNELVVPISVRKSRQRQEKKREILIKEGIEDNLAIRQVSREKKKIHNIEKAPLISFREPNQNETRRTYTDIGAPNIVMSSPYKKRSPAYKKITTPIKQDHTIEGLHSRKNNVYLNQGSKPFQQQEISPKLKKQIKGNTYLEKYNRTKNISPQKIQPVDYQSKKYNKTIKSFNQNNRIYQKIQSPPKKPVKPSNKYEQILNKPRDLNETTPTKKKYQYVFN